MTPPPLLTSFLPLPQARFRRLVSHGNERCCLLCTYVHITMIGAIKRQEDVRCMGRPSPMSSPAPYQALYVVIGGAASGVAFSASKPLEPVTNAPHRMASWNLRSTVGYRSSVVFVGPPPLCLCAPRAGHSAVCLRRPPHVGQKGPMQTALTIGRTIRCHNVSFSRSSMEHGVAGSHTLSHWCLHVRSACRNNVACG